MTHQTGTLPDSSWERRAGEKTTTGVTKGDGVKEASGRLLYLHGWKLRGPGKAMVMPGDQAVWETLDNYACLAMQARLEQLIAMMRGALFLQATMAKHLLQP